MAEKLIVTAPGGNVIDKYLPGQKLATPIGAHVFVILTDIDAAYLDYGTPQQERIAEITSGKLRTHLNERHFKEGSTTPKVEAAIRFVEVGGERAIISELGKLVEAMDGKPELN